MEAAGLEPRGAHYALEVSPYDKIHVTIKHQGIEIEAEITMAIVARTVDQAGKMGCDAEFFCHQISSKNNTSMTEDEGYEQKNQAERNKMAVDEDKATIRELAVKVSNLRRELVNQYNISEEHQLVFMEIYNALNEC